MLLSIFKALILTITTLLLMPFMQSLYNDIQWNLWYKIILVVLELREAIKVYQKEYVKEFNKEDLLNAANQQTLNNIKDFLQPFERVIKETEGNIATLNKVLFIIDFIVEYFKLSLVKYATNQRLCNTITTSQHAFNKYYLKTDSVTVYGAALLLAPH